MDPASDSTTRYFRDFRLLDWWVRPSLNRLERDGEVVQIEPKAMEVLVDLAAHPGELRSKRRLLRVVWGDAFVTDDVLTRAISQLRKELGDDARNPKYIETIPRQGYRLVAPRTEPEKQAFRYRILEKLGGGGMGVVYRAEDTLLRRIVALKFLPAELSEDSNAKQRFLQEARAAARLIHPNIAVVHDVGEDPDGRMYIAMDCYDGETIKKKVARGALPIDQSLDLATQISRGLAAAHAEGIVHRDIKPANVMVTKGGDAKIVDFGLAKLAGTASLTRTGGAPGTVAYMSPEQLLGQEVDHRTDLWSLGVVLYEMLAGKRPFAGDSSGSAVQSILQSDPPPLSDSRPDCPQAARDVAHRLLRKNPSQRPGSAEKVATELAGAKLASDLTDTMPAALVERLRRHSKASAEAQAAEKTGPLDQLRTARTRPWLKRLGASTAVIVLGALVLWGVRGLTRLEDSELARSRVEIQDQEARRLLEQAELYEQKGYTRENLANAERLYRAALDREPANPRIRAKLAALLAQTQRTYPDSARREEISTLTDQVLAVRDDLSPAWVARSTLLLLDGDAAGAEIAARKAVLADSQDFEGYTLLGESLIAQKRVEEGLAELRTGAEAGKGYVWAREALGLALLKLGQMDQAEAELQKVMNFAPDSPATLNNLGVIYLRQGRDADAIPIFNHLLSLQPRHELATRNLGTAYFNLGRFEESIDAFERAHELAPEKPENLQYVGEAYEKLGDRKAAREWFERALEGYDAALEAGGPKARGLGQRAVCAAKLGRHQEATKDIEAALELEPADTELVYLAAQVFALGGDHKSLLEFTQRALESGHSRDWFHTDPVFETYLDNEEFRALLEFGKDAP